MFTRIFYLYIYIFLSINTLNYVYNFQVLAPQGQDAIGEDMRAFADQLRPLVQLNKIDYKQLGHMTVT